MSGAPASVTCIGLAPVDIIASVDDAFMVRYSMVKGDSNLLDSSTTGVVLGQLSGYETHPGGCAANTACGLGELGIDTRFVGKTGEDGYGEIFRQGFAPYGVAYDTRPFPQKMTSLCLTLITPDKNHSFAFCTDTAAWQIAPQDLPDLSPGPSQIVFLESNLACMTAWGGRAIMNVAAEKYTGNGNRVIVTLSDRVIVEKARAAMLDLLREDIFFFIGNIGEAQTLFEMADAQGALGRAVATGRNFALTDGPGGVYVIDGAAGTVAHVPALPISDSFIVNTVGAGDQFAAGFIAGLARGFTPEDAAGQGIETASRIIQHVSARPPPPRNAARRARTEKA